ncbi:hypothetical protein [Leptospira noguchii]|nr:hypothetical protein [Leptospira noguchii]MCH1910715.1 hypothetical protein [Leptospira noguchii]MCH1917156.1 hypothetical protein [Leptospira noguchii]UOG62886.1 hypothetical protein MAL04_10660 [Leptospira noguchii]
MILKEKTYLSDPSRKTETVPGKGHRLLLPRSNRDDRFKKIYTALGSDFIRAIQNALKMTGKLILSRLRKINPERLKFLNAEHIDFPYFKKPDEVLKELFVLISTLEKVNIQIEISNQSQIKTRSMDHK